MEKWVPHLRALAPTCKTCVAIVLVFLAVLMLCFVAQPFHLIVFLTIRIFFLKQDKQVKPGGHLVAD